MSTKKLIKMIGTKNFEVSLYRDQDDMYQIEYIVRKLNEASMTSENITDFSVASYLFDLKVQDLQGH